MNVKLEFSIKQLESIIEGIEKSPATTYALQYITALHQVVDRLKSIESDKVNVDIWTAIWDKLKKAEREEFKNDNLKK